MKKLGILFLSLLGLMGCSQEAEPVAEVMAPSLVTLEVGVETQIQEEILRSSLPIFQDEGYELLILQRSEGENQVKEGGKGTVFYYNPLGIYTEELETLENFPDDITVFFPTERESDALGLLEREGLLSLRDTEPFTIESVEANYYNIRFVSQESEAVLWILCGETARMTGKSAPLVQDKSGAVAIDGDAVLVDILIGSAVQTLLEKNYNTQLKNIASE